MVSNKLNTGEFVASEMESLMSSEEYRSLFKPSLTVTAAKKKDDEDKKKKCKCPPFCKCPGSKGEKCKCKKHKKEAAVEEVAEMLAKVSEQLDEANLSKTAAAALKLIAEAMDECSEDECSADDGDDNEARVDPGSSIDVGVSSFDDELDSLIREQKEDMDSEETLEEPDTYKGADEELSEDDEEGEEEDDYSLIGDEDGEGVRALMSELHGLDDDDDADDGLTASAAAKDKDKEKAKKEKEKAKAQALKEKEKAQAAKEKEKEKAAKEKEKEKAAKEKEKAKKDKK